MKKMSSLPLHVWGLLFVLLLFVLNVSLYFDFSEDDPGISFRYAANLFEGKGLAYNPGERVEGYSNFGYVLFTGGLYKCMAMFCADARPYLVIAAKIANLLASLGTLLLCYGFSRIILKQEAWKGVLVALLVASNGAFAINTASPLETATYTLLLMLLTWFIAHLASTAGTPLRRGPFVAGIVLALVFSIWRIDAPLLLGACFVAYFVLRGGRLQRRDMGMFGAWFAVYAGYTLFRYLYFGQWLNNPYYAKVDVHFATQLQTQYTNVYFTHLGDNAYLFLLLFFLAVACDYRRYLLPGMLVVAQWAYIARVGGDWMTGFRFWAPLTPQICLLLVSVIDRPFKQCPARWERLLKVIIVGGLAAWWLGSGIAVYQLGARQPGRIWRQPDVCSVAGLNPYWETAQWIRSHVKDDALMVISEGGYVPFLTGLTTIDTYGLCNRELAAIEGTRGRLGLKMHWKHDDPATQYVLSRKPDIIVRGPQEVAAPCLWDRFDRVAICDGGMHIYARRNTAWRR